ncbi:MAG: PQQ-binding-like beta-propeller repeat protein [Myxococcota bacterium]
MCPSRKEPTSPQWQRLVAFALISALYCMGFAGCADRLQVSGAKPSGEAVFAENCAVCHTLPILSSMFEQNRGRPPGFVYDAITTGNMRRMGAGLDAPSRRAVAEFFTGVQFDSPEGRRDFRISPDCAEDQQAFDWNDRAHVSWGGGPRNHRSVSSEQGFSRDDVHRLQVDWVVAFPESSQLRSHPTAAGGALFVGSHNGSVYALDQATGCTRWHFKADTEVRSAVTIDFDSASRESASKPFVRAVFADRAANVYALDATSGALLWKQQADPHPNAAVTGSISATQGMLFVPISSNDDINALDPGQPCCTHSGAVVALDIRSGEIRWTRRTVSEAPVITGRTELGTAVWGPSGASVWNTPTLDLERRRLFVGSGNNHSVPATAMSDSVLALELATGEVIWTYQSVEGDAWNAACIYGVGISCPDPVGPDTDFGATTILGEIDGQDRLFAGQKSGWLHALDPESGERIWKMRIANGGAEAGIRYGMALREDVLYVSSTHQAVEGEKGPRIQPGVVAVSARDGSTLWQASGPALCAAIAAAPESCNGAVTAPPLAMDDLIFAPGLDGTLFAIDRDSGETLWGFDTAREFTTLSGRKTVGGGLAGTAGPMFANGRLYVSSGYGQAQRPGNALIAFSLAPLGAAD